MIDIVVFIIRLHPIFQLLYLFLIFSLSLSLSFTRKMILLLFCQILVRRVIIIHSIPSTINIINTKMNEDHFILSFIQYKLDEIQRNEHDFSRLSLFLRFTRNIYLNLDEICHF